MASVPCHQFRYRMRHRLLLWKSVIGLAVAGSGLLTRYGHDNAFALTGAAVLLTLALVLFVLGRRNVALTLDDRGMRFGFRGGHAVTWPEIDAVQFRRIDGIGYLLVDRTAAARAAAPAGRVQSMLAKRCGAADLVVPLQNTIDDARQIHQIVAMALTIARQAATTVRR